MANAALISEGVNNIFSGVQGRFNAQIQQRMAGLQAAETRIQRGLFIQNAAVDRTFFERQQVTRRGGQASGFAKGGVRIGSGSALNTLVQQARIDRFNLARLDFNVAVQSRNLEIQAQQADYQKKIARINEGFSTIQTLLGVGQTAAGAAS